MVNEPTEEELAKLAKENPLFHGDFGHSINLRFLITVLILILVGIFLIIYKKKKRDNVK